MGDLFVSPFVLLSPSGEHVFVRSPRRFSAAAGVLLTEARFLRAILGASIPLALTETIRRSLINSRFQKRLAHAKNYASRSLLLGASIIGAARRGVVINVAYAN